MITNLTECINAILKGTCHSHITALVQSTYYRLTELFVKKGNQQLASIVAGHVYSEIVTKARKKIELKQTIVLFVILGEKG